MLGAQIEPVLLELHDDVPVDPRPAAGPLHELLQEHLQHKQTIALQWMCVC